LSTYEAARVFLAFVWQQERKINKFATKKPKNALSTLFLGGNTLFLHFAQGGKRLCWELVFCKPPKPGAPTWRKSRKKANLYSSTTFPSIAYAIADILKSTLIHILIFSDGWHIEN